MKTITEFFGPTVKDLNAKMSAWTQELSASVKDALKAEGKTDEEIATAFPEQLGLQLDAKITEATKLEGDKLKWAKEAVALAKGARGMLKRVIVMELAEGEKAPAGAQEREGKVFVIEYFAEAQARGGMGRDRDGGRGGRDGGRDGKRGGRRGEGRGPGRGEGRGEGRSEGRGPGRGGDERAPRATGGATSPLFVFNPPREGEASAGGRPPRGNRPPREPRAPREPRPPRERSAAGANRPPRLSPQEREAEFMKAIAEEPPYIGVNRISPRPKSVLA